MTGKNIEVVRASDKLQKKVGTGSIPPERIKLSQQVIDTNTVDFSPMALVYLKDLETALESAQRAPIGDNAAALRESLARPVMLLKASAALFHYPLISELAGIMLGLLDSYGTVDAEIITIVTAHHKTLHFVITKQMKGDGGAIGKQFHAELENACRRYAQKRGAPNLS